MKSRANDKISWNYIKAKCFDRDNYECRLCSCLSAEELGLRSNLKIPVFLLETLDAAHYLPVGTHNELTFDLDNIFTLCRSCHSNLDSYTSPITGRPISSVEHEEFWQRIINYIPKKIKYTNSNISSSVESWLDV